jgi:glycoside/pentoside/hexuronide:cation symporter, GPH family
MKMAIVMVAISAFFFYFSIAFVRETPQAEQKTESFSYFQAVAATFKNKAFVYWVICIFMFWLGFNVVMMAIPYYVTQVLGQGEGKAALYQGVFMLVTIPMFVVVFTLSKSVSKKKLIAVAMILLSMITPLFYVTRYVPDGLRQKYALALFALLGIPISVLLIMANAIIADIVDIDEAATGQRREAMYFGMQGLATKMSIAISAAVGGILLKTFGMSVAHPNGILLAGPFSALFTLIGFVAILFYPSEKTIADILAGAKNKQKSV